MSKRWRLRWTILLILAGLAAVFMPLRGDTDAKLVPLPTSIRSSIASPTINAAAASVNTEVLLQEPSDPFAPRGWESPAAPIKVEPSVAPAPLAAVVASVVEPTGPPALPYAFMGQMEDAGRIVVYLSRGSQTLIARPGETLENLYKVTAMDSGHVYFEHLPTGSKQVLSIPASE